MVLFGHTYHIRTSENELTFSNNTIAIDPGMDYNINTIPNHVVQTSKGGVKMGRASIKFFGIRGTQANTEYYVCMVPLSVLSKLFIFSDSELPPSIRSQRILNKARIPEMKRYIIQNRDSYVFSALTASVDGDIVFKPIDGIEQHRALGEIEISINNRIVINDGQHRKAAIDAALAECPELRYEDIAVVLFPDTGLKRSQQMFSDLNRYAIRPTKSINILYDQRDPFSAMICNIVEDLPMFGKWVDKEKASVSNRSRALFTLSGIYGSSQDLVKGLTLENEQDTIRQFWETLYSAIPEWQDVINGQIKASKLRTESLAGHAIVHRALAHVGNGLMRQGLSLRKLRKIQGIDWQKTNQVWDGHTVVNGSISASNSSVQYVASVVEAALEDGDDHA